MREYFAIGQTPSEEDCAQVGQPDYREKALAECRRYIELIRATLGLEPEGAELAIKSFPHDFGTYYEVVIWFEPDDAAAVAYATRCDDDAPRTWDEAYWTHCMYCGGMICGVEVLGDYDDVVILYAHKTCHERRTDGGAVPTVSGREAPKEVPADLPGDPGTGRTDPQLRAAHQKFCGCLPDACDLPC